MLDDVFGNYINNLGYNRKIPMVELVTINKHCREIAWIIKKEKKIFLLNQQKQEHVFWIVCGIFVANHFQVRIGKNEEHTVPENMRTAPTAHFVPLVDGTHLEISTSHTWILVS